MITMLMVSSLFCVTVFATANETNVTKNQQDKKDRKLPPRDVKNRVLGKITAISENSVTISVAEMKKPENKQDNNAAEKKDRQNLTDEQKADMKKKMEEMFTLTGETKTIDISQATFGHDRGIGQNNKDNNASNNNSNGNANNQKATKTYKDYAVGDYITIELTADNSNVAKRVSDMRPMGGEPRGKNNKNWTKDNNGNKKNKSNNNNNNN